MDKVVHFLTFTLFRFDLRENARSANEMRAKRQFFYTQQGLFQRKIFGALCCTVFQNMETFGGKCHLGTWQKKY